jgi:hypothetical protein
VPSAAVILALAAELKGDSDELLALAGKAPAMFPNVDQRLQFLSSYQKEEMSVTDQCHEYSISRPAKPLSLQPSRE